MNSSRKERRLNARLRTVAMIAVGVLGTAIFHRYTVLSGLDRVQADLIDSRLVAALLEYWNAAWAGAGSWRSPAFFYPVPHLRGYSELLLGFAVPYAGLRTLGLDVFQALNSILILITLATYFATHAMLRRGIGTSSAAAVLGAAFYAFGYPRFASLGHIQLQFTVFPPLMLWALLAVLRRSDAMSTFTVTALLLAASVMWAATLATVYYFGWFLGLFALTSACVGLTIPAVRRAGVGVLRRHWFGVAVAMTAAAVLLEPVARVYLPVARQTGGRPWGEVLASIPEPWMLGWLGAENMVWGRLFERLPADLVVRSWAEGRIGIGVVATLAVVLAIAASFRVAWTPAEVRDGRLHRDPFVAWIVLTAVVSALLATRAGALSAWRLVFAAVPGATAIRGVTRYYLLLTLPATIAVAVTADRLWAAAAGRRPARAFLVVAAVVLMAEQLGTTKTYSGARALALSVRVGAAVGPECEAFILLPASDHGLHATVLTRETFDPGAYLAANPDVAAGWSGTAWEHYEQFGRTENRFLDLQKATAASYLLHSYSTTAMLASALRRVPTLNGYAGWLPPGYQLFDVLNPLIEQRIDAWAARRGIRGTVCRVRLDYRDDDLVQMP